MFKTFDGFTINEGEKYYVVDKLTLVEDEVLSLGIHTTPNPSKLTFKSELNARKYINYKTLSMNQEELEVLFSWMKTHRTSDLITTLNSRRFLKYKKEMLDSNNTDNYQFLWNRVD